MAEKENKNRLRSQDKTDQVMIFIWACFILLGVFLSLILLAKIIRFNTGDFRQTPIYKALIPTIKTEKITPSRGDILDCKGRLLATSTLVYDVHLDCAAPADSVWNNGVDALASQLAATLGDRSAEQYRNLLQHGRKCNSRYLHIHKGISQLEINKIRKMPIFRKGRMRGGYLETVSQERMYPYGSSARRTIGYVRNNADSSANRKIGIEGAFDDVLHGKDGFQTLRKSDFGMIPISGSKSKKAVHGKDIRTTIDIDIQNIADIALRKAVSRSELIEKACAIVLDVKTGAVKAMVNLGRNEKGEIGEWDNYAIRMAEAPGSIFKTVVTMALLEEGYIKSVEDEIPTHGGIWRYNGFTYNDIKHVGPKRFPSGKVKVREAFAMSANNPFRQLLCNDSTFGKNPARFISKVREFGLLDTLDFDLKGNTPPFILEPSMKKMTAKGAWDGGTFPRMAIGYGMELSPLNLITFYNSIANDGKVMKPYLIDAIMEDGHVEESFSGEVLHEHICSRSTIDTLKRVMSIVTSDKGGTAYWQLRGAVCPIAGKTGTAQRVFRMSNGKYGYHDMATGKESQQGSFVGFFPTDNPKYSAIAVVWCKPAAFNFYGASFAAPVFREIADKIYCLNED